MKSYNLTRSKHPSHITRISDASAFPCSNEPEEHRVARSLDSSQEFIDSTI